MHWEYKSSTSESIVVDLYFSLDSAFHEPIYTTHYGLLQSTKDPRSDVEYHGWVYDDTLKMTHRFWPRPGDSIFIAHDILAAHQK